MVAGYLLLAHVAGALGARVLLAFASPQLADAMKRKGFLAEVIEVSKRQYPSKVAFHFDRPLEAPEVVWLCFDWRALKYERFPVPVIGQTVHIEGPRPR